jgi:hypothetical protein
VLAVGAAVVGVVIAEAAVEVVFEIVFEEEFEVGAGVMMVEVDKDGTASSVFGPSLSLGYSDLTATSAVVALAAVPLSTLTLSVMGAPPLEAAAILSANSL